ncbi:Cmr1 protein [Saccharomycopsis crataegensis]|uniref:DNA damage-binding protein CMR1 n=1 Tax=Saccharomycopsis crataegensis TaxID=43959 RepID=A0AAV5QIS9_9ASCO|nr:Cmr1 protein [Saccharomycopsis crataegensis]
MVSKLEKQRLENIQRNKELLRSLSLDKISYEIKKDVEEKKAETKAKRQKRKTDTAPKEPIRKSRRLQGIKIEDTEDYQTAMRAKELQQIEEEKLEKLRTMKLPGNVSLIDILKEQNKDNEIKGEDNDDEKLLSEFSRLSDNFSVGDFYEVISKKPTDDKSINKLRKEFKSIDLYEKFLPNQISLTEDRLAIINFHPSNTEKIIVGGDILGNLGIWNPNSDTDENPAITSFNLHGKHISKIAFSTKKLNNLYTASYDNSIRCTDLKTLKSTEVLGLLDDNGNDIGISDIQLSTPNTSSYENLLFFTTLTGQFGSFDIRSKPRTTSISLYRLSDKKIGGFSINPNANYQLSTGSLDRTLKIWDLRKVNANSNWSEKFPSDACIHAYGGFSSRLSVSSTDWNSSGDIVCNGYADAINIFKLGDTTQWNSDFLYKPKKKSKEIIPMTLKPDHVMKHNCRTGKWVSILKARWQMNPKDGYEKFVIGNMQKFFDVYTANGIQVAHLGGKSITAVPAVANFHPTENWLVGGTASGKCVLFS